MAGKKAINLLRKLVTKAREVKWMKSKNNSIWDGSVTKILTPLSGEFFPKEGYDWNDGLTITGNCWTAGNLCSI